MATPNTKIVKGIVSICNKAKQKKGSVCLWSTSLFMQAQDLAILKNYQIGVHTGELVSLDVELTVKEKQLHFKDIDLQQKDLFQKTREILSQPIDPIEVYRDGLELFYPSLFQHTYRKKMLPLFDKKELIEVWRVKDDLIALRNKKVGMITLDTID